MNKLFLTRLELAVLRAKRPPELVGYSASPAHVVSNDSPTKLRQRIENCNVASPALVQLRQEFAKNPSPEKLAQGVSKLDFQSISDRDLGELMYALGPDIISDLVLDLLGAQDCGKNLSFVAGLTFIRETLFGSLSEDTQELTDGDNEVRSSASSGRNEGVPV